MAPITMAYCRTHDGLWQLPFVSIWTILVAGVEECSQKVCMCTKLFLSMAPISMAYYRTAWWTLATSLCLHLDEFLLLEWKDVLRRYEYWYNKTLHNGICMYFNQLSQLVAPGCDPSKDKCRLSWFCHWLLSWGNLAHVLSFVRCCVSSRHSCVYLSLHCLPFLRFCEPLCISVIFPPSQVTCPPPLKIFLLLFLIWHILLGFTSTMLLIITWI